MLLLFLSVLINCENVPFENLFVCVAVGVYWCSVQASGCEVSEICLRGRVGCRVCDDIRFLLSSIR